MISPSDPQSAWTATQQARAVWLRAELSHRHQERLDHGCRGDAGSHPRSSCRNPNHAGSNGGALRSKAERTCRRRGLRDGQVPRLAGQREEDHLAHRSVGEERSTGRYLLAPGRPLGRQARVLVCPNGKLLRTSGNGRRLLYRDSKRSCNVCPLRTKSRTNADACKIQRNLHEDARDAARRKIKTKAFARSRDEGKRVEMRFAHLKSGFGRMRLRDLSCARRVPSRCHCAEPEDARVPDTRAAEETHACVGCLGCVGVVGASESTRSPPSKAK